MLPAPQEGHLGFGLFFAGPSLSQKYTVEAGKRSHWQEAGHKVETVGWSPTVRTLPGWGIEGGSWENRQGVVNTPREREQAPEQSRSMGGTRRKEVCSSAPGTQIPCSLVTSTTNWNDWLIAQWQAMLGLTGSTIPFPEKSRTSWHPPC